jgi:hypothetical protein
MLRQAQCKLVRMVRMVRVVRSTVFDGTVQ